MLPENKALFTIGVAAAMLEVHPRTLRIYEQEGLIKPVRKGKWRYYSVGDIEWVQCMRKMIHEYSISIAAIKKLLQFTPCWKIINCPPEKRQKCAALSAGSLTEDMMNLEAFQTQEYKKNN